MKVLFIAPEIPWPLNKGTCQRSYALLEALAEQNEVTLSAPAGADSKSRLERLDHLIVDFIPVPDDVWERRRLPKTGGRLTRFKDYFSNLVRYRMPYGFQLKTSTWQQTLAQHLPKFDAFFCRYSYLIPVLEEVDPKRIIIDADDIQYVGLQRKALSWQAGWESVLLAIEAARTYLYERRLFRRHAQVLVCSELDKRRFKNAKITVVRNGLTLPDQELVKSHPQPNSLLFLGAFTYGANVEGARWLCRDVWPLVQHQLPEATLKIAGYFADKATLPFADQNGISLIGPVDDPRVTICESAATVVPLKYGTGTRIKIAESLGCGRVVVSTHLGAEGYEDITEREGLFRADTEHAMATCIVELLRDAETSKKLGRAARSTAEEKLAWSATTLPLKRELVAWLNLSE